MRLLAFDTSFSMCLIALTCDGKEYFFEQNAPQQQTRLILPAIKDLLKKASLSLPDLDAIAYGCGPGSFTGIRIASSVAKALAFAWDLPIIQISSMALIAQNIYKHYGDTSIKIVMDAKTQHLYCGQYETNTAGVVNLLGKEYLIRVNNLQQMMTSTHDTVLAGDGWQKHESHFAPMPKREVPSLSSQAMLQLAKDQFSKGLLYQAANTNPVYLSQCFEQVAN